MRRILPIILAKPHIRQIKLLQGVNQYSISATKTIPTRKMLINGPSIFYFSNLPRHQVLTMPALSPTMTQGKVVKWLKKVGEKIQEGEVICQIQTDKATVGFEVQDKGYLAQMKQSDDNVPVGTPLAVVVKKADQVASFSEYNFNDARISSKRPPKTPQEDIPKESTPVEKKKEPESSGKSYPRHSTLKMPALSPTMTQGKIVKWLVKQGQQFEEGDALCQVQTDKATVAYEASEKGIVAKILANQDKSLQVNEVLAVVVKKKDDVSKFSDFTLNDEKPQKKSSSQSQPAPAESHKKSSKPREQKKADDGGRVFASPAAKTLAKEKGINIEDVGKGSGPDGRIIRQDIEAFKSSQAPKKTPEVVQPSSEQKVPKKQSASIFDNPYQEISLSNMRKTIASRLTQSKTTIPHYYVSLSIEMDAVNTLRTDLNAHEKQNGVKISAMALALRDYPTVNSQWHGTHVKKFKYADVSVAVATQGGLITPIVFRADTLGLIEIAKRTKDIAKRAREGKLDPKQYLGGTCTISNLGMFGIDSVTSVINPPQSTILGVGKTEKKILFDEKSTNPQKPYRVASVMQVIVSADHRVVDGAVAAQWLTRVKKYLENPTQMLL